jgi:RNA polymerase sigma factor (sigma-70 family)
MTHAESESLKNATPQPPADEPSDYLLLGRFRTGCQEAATRIYFRYAKRLHALARTKCSSELASQVDAEDIVQSVFCTFFKGARSGNYDIPDGEDLWKLLLVIALNEIRAEAVFHRAAKRDLRMTARLEALDTVAELKHRGSDIAESFLRMSVHEALGRLTQEHRRVVELRLEGYDVAEIAGRVGRSKRSVERVLQQSRNQFTVLLREGE